MATPHVMNFKKIVNSWYVVNDPKWRVLLGRIKSRYESGIWEPGPNAMWKKRTPDELAAHLQEKKLGGGHQHRDEPPAGRLAKSPQQLAETLKSNRQKTQLAPTAEQQPKPAEAKPTEHPESVAPSKTRAAGQEEKRFLANSVKMGKGEKSGEFLIPALQAASRRMGGADRKRRPDDFNDLASEAQMAVLEAMPKFNQVVVDAEGKMDVEATQKMFHEYLVTAARNRLKDVGKASAAQKRKSGPMASLSQPDEEGRQIDVPGKSEGGLNEIAEAVASLSDDERPIAEALAERKNHRQIAAELGISESKAYRLVQQVKETLREKLGYEWPAVEKTRYLREHILPAVWEEIVQQSRQYGPRAPDFIRAVLEAMDHVDSQWEAILHGRHNFLTGHHHYAWKGGDRDLPEHPEPVDEELWEESKKAAEIGDGAIVRGRTLKIKDPEEVELDIPDFVTGGNHYVWKDIPENEIWCASYLPMRDLIFTIYHEITESEYMKKGKTYDEAHKLANGTDRILLERELGKQCKQSYEYGPRHQPSKRIEGAVCRLQALRDFCEDIEEETLADEVYSIAAEFDADGLKEVARDFGIEHPLGTKGDVCRLILRRVCKKRGPIAA